MRDTQIISSSINAKTTRTIIKSVNIFPPYVILICSAICHIALMLLYHKEKKMDTVKIILYLIITLFMICTFIKICIWMLVILLIICAILLAIKIIKELK